MIKALVAMEPDAAWDDYTQRIPAGVELQFCAGDVAAINAALDDDVEILLTDAMPSTDQRSAGLRWLQLLSAGTDQLIGHPLMRHDVRVSNAAGTSAAHIAEFIVARLLYHTKELRAFDQLQRNHQWPDRIAMSRPSLYGKQALIVGYGGVGRETARLLTALGMRIVAVARTPNPMAYRGYTPTANFGDPDGTLPDRIITLDALPEALASADVIVLAVPLTSATHHLIDARILASTKASAILINIARGAVIDTPALLAALDQQQLAHAYLDVFEQEPLPPDSPMWDHPHVSVTPHMAGVLPDSAPVLRDLFRQNLRRYIDGQTLINQLDRRQFI